MSPWVQWLSGLTSPPGTSVATVRTDQCVLWVQLLHPLHPPLPHHLPRHAPVTLRHSEKKIKTPGRSGSGGAKQAAINVRYLQSFHSIYTVQALQLNNNNNKTNLLILYKFSPWYHQIPPAMKNAARRGEGKFPNTFKCSQMSVDRRFVASTKTDAVCFLITSSVPIALGNIFFFLPICFLSVSLPPPKWRLPQPSGVELCLGAFISRVSGLTASEKTTTITIIITVDFITADGILMFMHEAKIAGS